MKYFIIADVSIYVIKIIHDMQLLRYRNICRNGMLDLGLMVEGRLVADAAVEGVLVAFECYCYY